MHHLIELWWWLVAGVIIVYHIPPAMFQMIEMEPPENHNQNTFYVVALDLTNILDNDDLWTPHTGRRISRLR